MTWDVVDFGSRYKLDIMIKNLKFIGGSMYVNKATHLASNGMLLEHNTIHYINLMAILHNRF